MAINLFQQIYRYVGLMCNVKSELQYLHQQDVVVLFCESTLRYVAALRSLDNPSTLIGEASTLFSCF